MQKQSINYLITAIKNIRIYDRIINRLLNRFIIFRYSKRSNATMTISLENRLLIEELDQKSISYSINHMTDNFFW